MGRQIKNPLRNITALNSKVITLALYLTDLVVGSGRRYLEVPQPTWTAPWSGHGGKEAVIFPLIQSCETEDTLHVIASQESSVPQCNKWIWVDVFGRGAPSPNDMSCTDANGAVSA